MICPNLLYKVKTITTQDKKLNKINFDRNTLFAYLIKKNFSQISDKNFLLDSFPQFRLLFGQIFLSQIWLKWKFYHAKFILFNFLTLLSKLGQIKQFLKKLFSLRYFFRFSGPLQKKPHTHRYLEQFFFNWVLCPARCCCASRNCQKKRKDMDYKLL